MSTLALAAGLLLCGCSTTATQQTLKQIAADESGGAASLAKPVQIEKRSRVQTVRSVVVPMMPVAGPTAGDWVRRLTVNLNVTQPTSLHAVLNMLAAQGLNISSPFPTDGYTFTGRLTGADGETALRAIVAAVGLDYAIDDARKLITLRSMASRTWYINLGARRTAFATAGASPSGSGSTGGTAGGAGQASSGAGASQGGQPAQTGGGQSSSTSSGGTSTASTGGASQGSSSTAGSTGVATGDDFWTTIASELASRLQVLVPASRGGQGLSQGSMPMGVMGQMGPMGGLPLPMGSPLSQQPGQPFVPSLSTGMGTPGMSSGSGGSTELFSKKTVGTFALNPDTGAITVQAPSWILDDLSVYLDRTQEMYNALITFRGQLLLVTSSTTDGEGLDISAFANFASKWGFVVSNNALGGLTVSVPATGATLPSVSAPNVNASTLLGLRVQGATSALQVFNAFLSERGAVSVVQRPVISTTSGAPGIFSKQTTDFYNTVSQQAAAGGTGSAAVGTSNTLVSYQTGMSLQVYPHLDVSTGLIRAPLSFSQVVKVRERNSPQTITAGSNVFTVNTPTPVLTAQSASGEVLLRDGDLIIVGGQIESTSTTDASGVAGPEGPMVGLLGNRKTDRQTATTYFALQVDVQKRK